MYYLPYLTTHRPLVGGFNPIYSLHIFTTITQRLKLVIYCYYTIAMFRKVGIAGDSFVSHLEAFIGVESQKDDSIIKENLGLDPDSVMITWHGVGGRTVRKFLEFDLPGIADLNVEAVVMQIGSNDLCDHDMTPEILLERVQLELLPHLHHKGIQVVMLCQVLRRKSPPRSGLPLEIYNSRVDTFNKLLESTFSEHYLAHYWPHISIFSCGKVNRIWRHDGVHLNWQHGQKPFYRSVRGAAIKARDLLNNM